MKTPENVPDNNVGRKTPEEIECGLECIRTNAERICVKPENGQCPRCEQIVQDHINLIHYLESRLAQAERELDAAVADLNKKKILLALQTFQSQRKKRALPFMRPYD